MSLEGGQCPPYTNCENCIADGDRQTETESERIGKEFPSHRFPDAPVLTFLPAHRSMSPHAARGVELHLPGAVVHYSCAPAVFHVKSGGRLQVERHHVIIGVPAQVPDNGDTLILTQVVGGADIIERLHL